MPQRGSVSSPDLSQRVKWIEINGQSVLLMDFSRAPVPESLAMIVEFDREMQGKASGSVLMLTDVSDADYDPSVARQWKEARQKHDAAIRASAIFGLKGLVGIAIRGFIDARRLLGMSAANEPRIFEQGDDARAWLGKQ